jgi:hypothetical protein
MFEAVSEEQPKSLPFDFTEVQRSPLITQFNAEDLRGTKSYVVFSFQGWNSLAEEQKNLVTYAREMAHKAAEEIVPVGEGTEDHRDAVVREIHFACGFVYQLLKNKMERQEGKLPLVSSEVLNSSRYAELLDVQSRQELAITVKEFLRLNDPVISRLLSENQRKFSQNDLGAERAFNAALVVYMVLLDQDCQNRGKAEVSS